MEDIKTDNEKIISMIKEAKNIGIIPSKLSGIDTFCAGAALYFMLKEHDKNVSFVYTGRPPEDAQNIITEEELNRDVKQRSLLVSIDYSGTEAGKVNYSTEDEILYLKIGPIPMDFNKEERIKSRITGFDFDLIFILGAQNLYDLGQTYRNLDTVSKISKIVNIDNTSKNENFGTVNIVDPSINSISLLVFGKSGLWGLKPTEKSAKALLKGILSKEPLYKG